MGFKKLHAVLAVRQWLEIEGQLHLPLDNVIRFNNEAGLVGFLEVYNSEEAALEAAAAIGGIKEAPNFVFDITVNEESFNKNTNKYR